MEESTEVGLKKLLLRGLLGGAFGGAIWIMGIIAMMGDKLETNWGQWLFIGLLFYAPMGALVGGVVALVIWLIHEKRSNDFGWLSRFGIGTIVAIIWRLIQLWLGDTAAYTQGSWRSLATDVLYFAILLGGIAGLAVGHQARELSRPPNQDGSLN
jgi:uncharacterized membrane protein